MPRSLDETSQFKRDKKRVKRSGRHDWAKMLDVERDPVPVISHPVRQEST
jgi:hypothetical protein